ncbi:histidine kinase-like ATPase [Ochromonadaceae sp. CCMP2298]|nr:histidine kinase-like ATPase [Ochromonadaceae sp. CCMP2298]
MLGAQYSWGHLLSRIFADDVSGIDIVVQYRGFTFTCRVKEGVAEIIGGSQAAGYGDVASKKYAQYKEYVANAHESSQLQIETDDQYNLEMTFYPTEHFMKSYRTNLPIIVACCGVMLILLVSLVFVGYDVAVRGQLDSKEIVLGTKRRFVRFVSHEIRTPMNAVRLGMTLFSTEIDDFVAKLAGKSLEEVMEVLQTTLTDWRQIAVDVLDNSEAAVDVLNDLLNYDKIESGTLQLEFSMVPVWNVLQRTFKTFVLQAREKGIVFQLEGEMFGADASLLVGDLGSLHCLGDETRITQVLRNLMSNSLKFTEKTGVVTVLAEYLPNGLPNAVIPPAPRRLLANTRAGAVRITVVDDGAGLSPAQVLDICKEGVQFNVNTLQAGGGSGLGLFIGKGIVEQHGGTMRVSSEGLGVGATFVIELPMFEFEGLPLLHDVLSPRTLGGLEAGLVSGDEDNVTLFTMLEITKYLLVVDDSVSNRKLLVRILTSKGYICSEASDGQQALDVYRDMCANGNPPCAVLMDYEMPVMNGPTATKHLREMGCVSYIVGVTGNVMKEDVDVFHEHGANTVLAKPLRLEVFENMMASISAKNTPIASPTATPPAQRPSPGKTKSISLARSVSLRRARVHADEDYVNSIV